MFFDQMTKILLGKHVNTYTFTKSLAEKLLQNESKTMPVTIVRPSMSKLKYNLYSKFSIFKELNKNQTKNLKKVKKV